MYACRLQTSVDLPASSGRVDSEWYQGTKSKKIYIKKRSGLIPTESAIQCLPAIIQDIKIHRFSSLILIDPTMVPEPTRQDKTRQGKAKISLSCPDLPCYPSREAY